MDKIRLQEILDHPANTYLTGTNISHKQRYSCLSLSRIRKKRRDDALENVDNEICPWWWSQQTKYSHVCIVCICFLHSAIHSSIEASFSFDSATTSWLCMVRAGGARFSQLVELLPTAVGAAE